MTAARALCSPALPPSVKHRPAQIDLERTPHVAVGRRPPVIPPGHFRLSRCAVTSATLSPCLVYIYSYYPPATRAPSVYISRLHMCDISSIANGAFDIGPAFGTLLELRGPILSPPLTHTTRFQLISVCTCSSLYIVSGSGTTFQTTFPPYRLVKVS